MSSTIRGDSKRKGLDRNRDLTEVKLLTEYTYGVEETLGGLNFIT